MNQKNVCNQFAIETKSPDNFMCKYVIAPINDKKYKKVRKKWME